MESNTADQIYQQAQEAVVYLRDLLKEHTDTLKSPKVGVICGSGLGGLASTLNSSPKVQVPFSDIPHLAGVQVITFMLMHT